MEINEYRLQREIAIAKEQIKWENRCVDDPYFALNKYCKYDEYVIDLEGGYDDSFMFSLIYKGYIMSRGHKKSEQEAKDSAIEAYVKHKLGI